ncbi:MAG: ferrous iron transport protein A [Clostridiales bacterium]|nr:ferrous iron transport protein A [Clostridiales bacterium]
MQTLSEVPIGTPVTVAKIQASAAFVGRLQDMGLTRGTSVTCLFAAPRGNPRAYRVRGGIVVMRNVDASKISVKLGNK